MGMIDNFVESISTDVYITFSIEQCPGEILCARDPVGHK